MIKANNNYLIKKKSENALYVIKKLELKDLYIFYKVSKVTTKF